MGKILLLLGVLVVALAWWALGRKRDAGDAGDVGAPPARRRGASRRDAPAAMLACAHCGLHLPQPEAQFDADGRPYCSEAHRLAGPR
jgi:uncharacterized protein